MTDADGGAAEPLAFQTGELPDLGEDDRLVLMAVDPYLVYAYWNLTAPRVAAAQALFGKDELEAHVLRFHDTTGMDFDGVNCGISFDVKIRLEAGKWYVRLWSPERRYCADIGLRGKDGRLVALVRSNLIETPAAWPHVRVDEAAALVEQGSPAGETVLETEPAPAALEAEPAAAAAPGGERSAPVVALARADSRGVLARKLAEVTALRDEPLPSATPGHGEADLTEIAERSYVPGISSVMLGARGRAK
jgi:hypothetical protein